MPGEEKSIPTVEADLVTTAAEDEGTTLTDLKTEGDVVAQPEQEAQEPEQEAEQEPSFAEALETAKPLLEGLKESDSEQYGQLKKLFGDDDVDAKTAALEQREAGLIAAAESQSAFAEVKSAYAPDQQKLREGVTSFGNAVAQTVNKATQEAGGQPTTSGPRVAAAIQEQVDRAENTGRATGMADSFLEAKTAALMSTLGAKLTTDELKEIGALTWQEAVTTPRETYGKLFDTMLKAAVRSAPEEAVKQGVAKNKATKEAAAVLESLVQKLPKNGKVPVTAALATQTFEDLEHLYAIGEATPAQETEYRKARASRGLE